MTYIWILPATWHCLLGDRAILLITCSQASSSFSKRCHCNFSPTKTILHINQELYIKTQLFFSQPLQNSQLWLTTWTSRDLIWNRTPDLKKQLCISLGHWYEQLDNHKSGIFVTCIQGREILLLHTARDHNVCSYISLCNALLIIATHGQALF